MKKTITILLSTVLLLILFTNCGKDNYDEPKGTLTGTVTYEGTALDLPGSKEKIRLQLYEDGYPYRNPIEVFVGQEGAFSAKLFDGQYKLVTKSGNGPWVNSRDTMVVDLRGSATIKLEVTPFFLISDQAISLSGDIMSATFTIKKIVETAEIERVTLLLSSTSFVDEEYPIMRRDFTENLTTGAVTFSTNIMENEKEVVKINNAKAIFGRVCVKTRNADLGIYSKVVRLK